jgi:hypothetical protein
LTNVSATATDIPGTYCGVRFAGALFFALSAYTIFDLLTHSWSIVMKRVLLSCLLSTVIALPALAALKEGDAAPDFSTQASLAGKAFQYSLKDALKKGPVVVYFYPSAYTAQYRQVRRRRCDGHWRVAR